MKKQTFFLMLLFVWFTTGYAQKNHKPAPVKENTITRSNCPVTVTANAPWNYGFDEPEIIIAPMALGAIHHNLPALLTRAHPVTNAGGVSLIITELVSASPQITIANLPLTIAPGETQNLIVNINAQGLPNGAYSGNFVITTNDPNKPQVTVPVSGTVSAATYLATLNENFNATGTPAGWNMAGFGRYTGASGGVDGTGGFSGTSFPTLGITQMATTPFVMVKPNEYFSFAFRAVKTDNRDVPTNPDVISYGVRISTDWGFTWSEIRRVDYGEHAPAAVFQTIYADATAYAGQIVRFRIFVERDWTDWDEFDWDDPTIDWDSDDWLNDWVSFDDVILGARPPIDDLTALSFSGSRLTNINRPTEYTVNIRNSSFSNIAYPQDYTVRLMNGATVIQTLPGVELAPFETAEFVFTWTPGDTGVFQLYGEAVMPTDANPNDNKTLNYQVEVLPEGIGKIAIGTGSTVLRVPVSFHHRHSLSQTLYYPEELETDGATITSITYTAYCPGNNSYMAAKPIRIWMGTTEMNEFAGNGWVDPTELTEVYSGIIDFDKPGYFPVTIELDQPFDYDGGNLVIYTYKRDNTVPFNGHTSNGFRGTWDTWSKGRSIRRATSLSVGLNPADPYAGGNNNNLEMVIEVLAAFPNITIMTNIENRGSVWGVVSDANGPIKDALVKVGKASKITNASGAYSFTGIPEGEVNLEVSMMGYHDASVSVVIIDDGQTMQNITLTPRASFNISGKVTSNLAPTVGIEGVQITLSGYSTFNAVSDANGDYLIEGVYDEFAYNVMAVLPDSEDYVTFSGEVVVNGDHVVYNIMIHEPLWPVVYVTATPDGNNVAIEWSEPAPIISFRYDSGVCSGQLGFTSDELPQGVMGSCHRVGAYLSKIQWFLTDISDASHVNIYIFDLNASGNPTNTILYSQTMVPTTLMEWNEFVFPMPVSAPNGFYMALSRPVGIFLGIGTSSPTTDWPFQPNTHFYNDNFQTASFETLEPDFELNLMLRAEGTVAGKSVAFGYQENIATSRFSDVVGATPAFIPAAAPFETKMPEFTPSTTRAHTGYNVYRLLKDQPEAQWSTLQSNTSALTYSDIQWNTLPMGEYQYAVKAVYTSGVLSNATLSNILPKDMYTNYQINITTNSGHSPAGAVVKLTNQNGNSNHVYTQVANGDGAYFAEVWKGTYNLTITLSEYETYSVSDLTIMESGTIYDAMLIDFIQPISEVTAEIVGSNVLVNWFSLPFANDWLKWCINDTVTVRVGYSANEGADMTVAMRFTPADLAASGVVSGHTISKIALGMGTEIDQVNMMEIIIWEGGTSVTNPGQVVYTQPITNYASFPELTMTEIELTTPFVIDATKELRIGWRLINAGGYPFGRDAGPAVSQKGTLFQSPVLFSGSWVCSYAQWGWNTNYSIKAFVTNLGKSLVNTLPSETDTHTALFETSKQMEPKGLIGYTVYRLQQGQPESEWIELADEVTLTEYTDVNWIAQPAGMYQYAVKAQFGSGFSAAKLSNVLENIPPQFTVTVASNNTTWGTASGGGTGIVWGTSTTVTATVTNDVMYEFVRWTVDGNEVSTEAVYTFPVYENMNLLAIFKLANTYIVDVNINPDDAGIVTGVQEYYYFNDLVEVTAVPNEAYNFVDWTKDGETLTDNPLSFNITADVELTANFVLKEIFYNVTVLANGSGNVEIVGYSGTTANIAKGTTVTVRATADTEWAFVKWTDEEEDVTTNVEYSFEVIREIVLTAHFALGIKDNILSNVILFPNPFKDEITISNPELVKSVQITNLLGQKIKEITFDGKSIITRDLGAGFYFIEIESFTGETSVNKMVKN